MPLRLCWWRVAAGLALMLFGGVAVAVLQDTYSEDFARVQVLVVHAWHQETAQRVARKP